ncbi:hypothetical protein O7621_00575 [Solwaraspora sp. WMMD937]|uniref:hypothetical protein n=1 Tax=Solwaraspora sp. WMMD937 TaxID=3016090 RepID=UPI00249A5184|nr:hypothetical protein [Solwaraspora sp. WMMD937]WFE21924.1 hypothetical protein O7621_00575 [Solwaraspora sp. WMMD937]
MTAEEQGERLEVQAETSAGEGDAPVEVQAETSAGEGDAPVEAQAETSAGEGDTPVGVEPSPQRDPISERVSAAYEKVPAIGDRWTRWYDLPYKMLWFLQTRWRRKVIPNLVLRAFQRWSLDLSQFNALERFRIWDPTDRLHDFQVPADEHVNMPSIWVVELFPPSAFSQLERAIDRNGWDRNRWMSGVDETNANLLLKYRARMGWSWWRIASIQGDSGTYLVPDAVHAQLPPEFGYIELKAIQVGVGLTAVVAYIELSELGATQLDEVWHEPHEPMLTCRDGRLHALDRMWAGFQVTQAARERLHQLARKWMNESCGGAFAEFESPQTLVDMLILDRHDPTDVGEDGDRDQFDMFRALGITETTVRHYTSADIPKMHLVPTLPPMVRGISTDRTWALWGQRQAVTDIATHLAGYGNDPNRAIAHRYRDEVESFLISLAVSDWLEMVEARYALIRDRARAQHGRFSAKVTDGLREQLLTLSIDVATLRRDLERSWKLRPRFEGEVEFSIEYSPRLRIISDSAGESIHMNAELRRRQKEWFEELTAADRDYRDILSTVASLGASVDAAKTGRRALGVAFVSLMVAFATVVVTDIGDSSLLNEVLEFLQSRL